MVSNGIGGGLEEVQEELTSNATEGFCANGRDALNTSTSQKRLLGNEIAIIGSQDWPKLIPGKLRLLGLNSSGGIASPTAKFRQIAEERDEFSRSVPSSSCQGFQRRFKKILARKIDWKSLVRFCQKWIRQPLNMALLLWISCVGVSGAILFLVMTGMLNGVLPDKSQRNAWFEVNNQILNALFTLMCLYQHPKRFHHLVLLCRWKPEDITTLRKIYCKNGTYKPHEWAHMLVVIVLLHVNCFAQYALCGLNLGYKRSERPALGVGICLSVAITAPAIAGMYSILSPLGREYDFESDEEAQDQVLTNGSRHPSKRRGSLEKNFSFTSRDEQKTVEYAPVWRGELFEIWDDIATAYLSLFCTFCVFGWNMERLGFGNVYVHIATFLLFCTAPFWIFNLAAITIDNETVREALGLTGIALCVFGLLYGGFWRIQMRKRFNLPANSSCCGQPDIADCAQWLFCCWCSLAQEVRTADYYDIVEDKFCRKETGENGKPPLTPLPREDGTLRFKPSPNSPNWNSTRVSRLTIDGSPSPTRFSKDYSSLVRHLPRLDEEFFAKDAEKFTKPPVFQSVQRDVLPMKYKE
ncbi:hypothetical protein HS088_TW13G00152 [Tripterygium wilfordii]|uniref:PLAC8 family protein n=1 Tax=Tripterygium wilfordii TaxID=458696 RepID=A0A7J7CT51_TRIWF|nr:uncharacterized protein LOC120011928 [Tripterygium wilfordii]KAF5737273.1 hypothetical protein HS088_TW13G00152 [Tripterygium wilfordii]